MPAFRARVVLTAAALAVCGSVAAQNLGFMRDSVMSYMTPEDTRMIQSNYLQALELPDGHVSTWSNPRTGASGTATPLKSFQDKGMACRQLEMSNTARNQTSASTLVFCKTKQGWRIAS